MNTTEADSASTDMSAMRSKLQRLRLDEHNRDEDEHMSEGVADTCAKHGNGGQEDVVNDEDNKSETRENEVERDLWDRIARFEKQKTAEAELRRERRTAACSEPHDERDKDTWLLEELGLYMWE